MPLDKVLVTGSCGLVGSAACRYFLQLGCEVVGIDNNQRRKWFGEGGDVSPMRIALGRRENYHHIALDITHSAAVFTEVNEIKPDLIIHAAAQPSHEKSAEIPWEDFNVNAQGTVNLLEAFRRFTPGATFVFVSTNKVYGDLQTAPCTEKETRFELAYPEGFDQDWPIDQELHSPFGASKAAADLMVQEYGNYYGLNTVCFRCGCITGKSHRGVEQHGFLAYLCKCAKQNLRYTIYGYNGKQVRDNIHAYDLVRAFHLFAQKPRPGAVYNIGGGHENSCSIIEALQVVKEKTGKSVETNHGPVRKADHRCYWTNNSPFQVDYPDWRITITLDQIFDELLEDGDGLR